jgi:hypothetical protein
MEDGGVLQVYVQPGASQASSYAAEKIVFPLDAFFNTTFYS